MIIEVNNEKAMKQFGARLGGLLRGGDVLELVGDVGAGKTTLTKGIARGLDIDEDVQSPSFTISRVYNSPYHLRMAHYDFYRLHDAGIMANELAEVANDQATVTIIEWASIVEGVLPVDRLTLQLVSPTETDRRIEISAGGSRSHAIREQLV